MLFPTMPAPITTARALPGSVLMRSPRLPRSVPSGRQLIYQSPYRYARTYPSHPRRRDRPALGPGLRRAARPADLARDPARGPDRRGRAHPRARRRPDAGQGGGAPAGPRGPGRRLPAPRDVRVEHRHHEPHRHHRRALPARAARGGPGGDARRRGRPARGGRADVRARRRRDQPGVADRARRPRPPVHPPLLAKPVPGARPRPLPQHVASDLAPDVRPPAAARRSRPRAPGAARGDRPGRRGGGAARSRSSTSSTSPARCGRPSNRAGRNNGVRPRCCRALSDEPREPLL